MPKRVDAIGYFQRLVLKFMNNLRENHDAFIAGASTSYFDFHTKNTSNQNRDKYRILHLFHYIATPL